MNVTVQSNLYFGTTVDFYTAYLVPIYGGLVRAITYFSSRLDTQAWDNATTEDRNKSLRQATRIIDALNYRGTKVSPSQPLQFPRGSQTRVPVYVEFACFEIALKLLDGVDPEMELDNLRATSQGFEGVRTTYDRALPSEHILAGVPSPLAWVWLKPYLIDPRELRISRVN